jgi:phospholipid/cholesterol/gamma-HCH transport system ATP-binding protein
MSMRSSTTTPVIEVEDLTIGFPGAGMVLDGVSFSVSQGETLVVMGQSGCGKSTLLKVLLGVHLPLRGAVRIRGEDLVAASLVRLNEIRKGIGVLFQSGALYNSLTVAENVALPMREHTRLHHHIIDIMVKMKLELVGLRDFEHLMPAELSGGMKKRVGLARAIALDPEILFYDEPGAGLDPIMTGVIDQLIMDLSHKLGVTSVVVTHEMASAFKIADRLAMLHDGRIVAVGTPEEIRDTDDPVVRQFITGAPDGPIPLRLSMRDYAEDLLEDLG